MCFLVFTTIFHNRQENFISYIYDTESNCQDIPQVSSNQHSSVPPHYLVIPYREFALRTSIACRQYKLDNPRKDLEKLHPKYSSYLRGRFPYIVPNENITFDDVEEFYTKILVNKKNSNESIDTSFAKNITFENIPYKFEDNMWHPIGVTSSQRTAILVPLQGREFNAKAFLLNMHETIQILHYPILRFIYTCLVIGDMSRVTYNFNYDQSLIPVS